MPIHAMIDLETFDTCPQATVTTIGGVKFDPFFLYKKLKSSLIVIDCPIPPLAIGGL